MPLAASRLLHPRDAIAVRVDRAVDDLAARWGHELHAVAAALIAVRLVLILHCFLRCLLLRRGLFARHDTHGQGGSGQKRCAPQKQASRESHIVMHGVTAPRVSPTKIRWEDPTARWPIASS